MLELGGAQALGQRATVGEVRPALRQQLQEALADPVGALSIGVVGTRDGRAGERLQRHVVVLEEKQPAGAQCGDHPGERSVARGDVGEHEAGVDEVKPVAGGRIVSDVLAADVHGRACRVDEP